MYTSRLKRYCDAVEKNPDELISLKLIGLQSVSTELEFEAENLLENFLESPDLKPSAKLAILTAVKSFYASTRGRDLASDVGENIEVPEAKKRTPSIEDCIALDEAMTTHRDKFLVWFLESSPVRQGTLRKLLWKDLKPLDDKDVPFWISIGSDRLKGHGFGKYKGSKHVGFLHSYAVQKLEAYKEELKQRGFRWNIVKKDLKKGEIAYNEDSPLFMCYNTNPHKSFKGSALQRYNGIFNDASLIAWKDLFKKRFSPHDFRDIIGTVLEKPQIKANVNLAKPLTSHKPLSIESVYANHPDSDYLELFKMCLPYLIPETVPELKIEINEQKTSNQKYQLQITEQGKELSEIRKEMANISKNFWLMTGGSRKEAVELVDSLKG